MIRKVFAIARRDIGATIWSRGFLIWLLMPILGLGIGLASAMIGSSMAERPSRAVAVIDPEGALTPWLKTVVERARTRSIYAGLRYRFAALDDDRPFPPELARAPDTLTDRELDMLARPGRLEALRDRTDAAAGPLVGPMPYGRSMPQLVFVTPDPDPRAQAKRLLRIDTADEARRGRFAAVLLIDGEQVRLLHGRGETDEDALSAIVNDARERRALAAAGLTDRVAAASAARQPLVVEQLIGANAEPAPTREAAQALATATTFILFMLIGLLAQVLLSNMVEEKGNKVIEVLVAAVPVPAIFAGKLIGMLGIALIGLAVWGALFGIGAAALLSGLPEGMLPTPATGWSAHLALSAAYFVSAYLIYGAVYLGIGSLCSSIREVQSLSLPVTIVQTLVLLGTLAATRSPSSLWAEIVAWFPLSSPYMMAARSALEPGVGIHLAAIIWQLLFAAAVIVLAARLFRYGVLNSGPPSSLWRIGRQLRTA